LMHGAALAEQPAAGFHEPDRGAIGKRY